MTTIKEIQTETIQDEEKEEECTNLKHHVEETIVGCFEEKNNLHLLKPTYYLYEAKCYKCKRSIAHATNAKKMIQKKKLC